MSSLPSLSPLMLPFSIQTIKSGILIDIVLALLAHLWFNRFEIPRFASPVGAISITLALSFPCTIIMNQRMSFLPAFVSSYTIFLSSLFTSIVIYRLSPCHPFAKYPGPIPCRISKLWLVWMTYTGRSHTYIKNCHETYGSIVRIGPNELSIVDKDYIPHVLGHKGMPKGPLWDGRRLSPNRAQFPSAISIRDLEHHSQLRKPWNKAFSTGPLSDYDQILVSSAGELLRHLEDACSASHDKVAHIDISKWISYFSFDFMGALVFGENFDIMKFRDQFKLLDSLDSAMRLIALVQHAPWLGGAIRLIQFGKKESHSLGEFTLRLAQRRASQVSKQNDLFYHLLQAIDPEQQASPLPYLVANASVFTVAGSDTAASVLSNTIYYLLCNTFYYSKLREEIDTSFPPSEIINIERLASLPFLNAVINETLRLQPPVPTGLQRAPTEGTGNKELLSMVIPEQSAILIPPYVYHRDPRYFFPKPDTFWPERWLQNLTYKGEFRLDRSAFIPFSSGPANCVGKTLALHELRYVIASLVRTFDMTFQGGYDHRNWESGLHDNFTLSRPSLPVKLALRAPVFLGKNGF